MAPNPKRNRNDANVKAKILRVLFSLFNSLFFKKKNQQINRVLIFLYFLFISNSCLSMYTMLANTPGCRWKDKKPSIKKKKHSVFIYCNIKSGQNGLKHNLKIEHNIQF